MLKKSASCVLGRLTCSRTPLYAPRAKVWAALLDLARPKKLHTGERAFLNILRGFWQENHLFQQLQSL